MTAQPQPARKECRIFYDVDSQDDFIDEKGALPVPRAREIRNVLLALTTYTVIADIPVRGSVDCHFGTLEYKTREGELQRWGGQFPDHCMNGSHGQKKIPETICWIREEEHALYLPHLLSEATPERMLKIAKHAISTGIPVYFEKQSYEVFTNPLAEILLREESVKEAIVYGVATDFCVRAAVLGMQRRGIQCFVVENAIRGVFPSKSALALEEMAAAGARFVTAADVIEGRI